MQTEVAENDAQIDAEQIADDMQDDPDEEIAESSAPFDTEVDDDVFREHVMIALVHIGKVLCAVDHDFVFVWKFKIAAMHTSMRMSSEIFN